ncbi:MAG: replicative DNA helicase [Gammaproteobacteria bacterium]|nr:replicative DNA helicase [Gammaproteobacteria bacterium]
MAAEPKLPPQALEAEQSLLGGLLLDNRKWDEIAGAVTAEDFYDQNHRLIFAAISSLQEDGKPVDIITVTEFLEKREQLEKAGGAAYISGLANNTPGVANILAYVEIVRDRSILRALILASNDIAESAYNPLERAPRDVLDYAEQKVFEISERDGRRRKEFTSLPELLARSIERIELLAESEETITGVPTGFYKLDEMTAGLQPGDLIIVAGRPSMGKTAFALNIAEYATLKKELTVAVFSMEMSGEQLSMRLLSSMGRINSNRVRTGQLEDADWLRLNSTMGILSKASMFVDDSVGLNPLELRSRARKLKREQGDLGLIIVDYLQLMDASSTERQENRATQISSITRSLKMLAKELEVPVVALSQLNRSVEQRPDKRPVMADLRESGAIEQDADVIIFIYRDEVYNPDSENKGTADIIIGKQRNGPIGPVKLTFLGECTRFENHAPEDFESQE